MTVTTTNILSTNSSMILVLQSSLSLSLERGKVATNLYESCYEVALLFVLFYLLDPTDTWNLELGNTMAQVSIAMTALYIGFSCCCIF